MRKPIVVAIQQPNDVMGKPLNLSAAHDYGELKILAPNGPMIQNPESFIRYVQEKFAELGYDPNNDFIIPVGDFTAILYVGMILGADYEWITVLRWNTLTRRYNPLKLVLS